MSTWIFTLAFRYIKGGKDRWISIAALLSSLGMTLGVATLITVLSLMQGFRSELMGKMLAMHGHINVYGSISNYEEIRSKMESDPLITHATPVLEQQLVATVNNQAAGVLMHGKIAQDLPKPLKAHEIILGKQLAQTLQVRVGDDVTMLSPQSLNTPFGDAPNLQNFKVAFIIKHPLAQYDRALALVNISDLQDFVDLPDVASNVLGFMQNPDQANILKEKFSKIFPEQNILSWNDNNFTFALVFGVESIHPRMWRCRALPPGPHKLICCTFYYHSQLS